MSSWQPWPLASPERDIFTMVATAPPPSILADDDEAWPSRPDAIVYDEVPSGLLTLADAATKYGVRHNTLEVALFRGNIRYSESDEI